MRNLDMMRNHPDHTTIMGKHALVKLAERSILTRLRSVYHRFCPRIVMTKNILGLRCRVNINDHLFFLLLKPQYTIEEECYRIMKAQWGSVWDIGSNFGFYSLVSAQSGNKVTAFDLSPRVLELLKQSCQLNQLDATTVPHAVTVEPITYSPPSTASCQNSIKQGSGDTRSVTYLEAETQYGTPSFIKMDIEGAEKMFFESDAFLSWLETNKISLLVELHNQFKPDLDELDCPNKTMVDPGHLFLDWRSEEKPG